MVKNFKKGHTHRHTPAFILLFLAKEKLYGAALLNVLQREMPNYNVDSAVIYRSLQDLEEEGAVKAYWETDISGPARKWYEITSEGFKKLAEFKEDIEMRIQNLKFFLDEYKNIMK